MCWGLYGILVSFDIIYFEIYLPYGQFSSRNNSAVSETAILPWKHPGRASQHCAHCIYQTLSIYSNYIYTMYTTWHIIYYDILSRPHYIIYLLTWSSLTTSGLLTASTYLLLKAANYYLQLNYIYIYNLPTNVPSLSSSPLCYRTPSCV